MRCLTVNQPWAWAILYAEKRIENRSVRTSHRGPLLIHAGKSRGRLGDFGDGEPDPSTFDFGAIIGVVQLVGCVPLAEVAGRPFAEGPWCWLLEEPRAFATPILYRGQLGLFNVPDDILASANAECPGLF